MIEDDTALRENTAELLNFSGYEVSTAPNGKIGLTSQKMLPQVIVCDIMMPEVDGYGVLYALSSDAATQHIPFFFFCQNRTQGNPQGMDMGPTIILPNLFEEEELLSAIESRLAKAHLLAQMPSGRNLGNKDAY